MYFECYSEFKTQFRRFSVGLHCLSAEAKVESRMADDYIGSETSSPNINRASFSHYRHFSTTAGQDFLVGGPKPQRRLIYSFLFTQLVYKMPGYSDRDRGRDRDRDRG